MRYNFERNIMTNRLVLMGLCLSLVMISGCVSDKSYMEEECENGICTSEKEYREVCTETPDGFSVCEDSVEPAENINYTRTQADFRKYGERTPRDHRLTQAGAGNNISAAVPPSIDDEVVDYEAEVMERDAPTTPCVNGVTPTGTPCPVIKCVEGVTPAGTPCPAAAVNAPIAETEENTETNSEEEDQNKDWLAEEGQSLKELLTAWSEESGWRLIWKTNRNYTLNAGAMFRGNFADVSSALVRAFARARPAPIATFYKGNRVLVIETMEDENAYD